MPPVGGKRKRGERTAPADAGNGEGPRPSPHRPGNLNLAQQQQQQQNQTQNRDESNSRGRNGRRPSRSNRKNGRRPSDGPNFQQRENSTGGGKVASPSMQSETDTPQPDTKSTTPGTTSSAPQQPTKTRPSSYAYDYLTQDCVTAWTSTGKQKLIDQGAKARDAEDQVTLSLIFQEVIQSVFEGRISAVDGGTCVKAIIGEAEGDQDLAGSEDPTSAAGRFDPRPVFLDTLSILTEPETSHPSLRPLVFSTDISPTLMRLQLETPLLQSLGLIRDTFARVGIRKQTNILYRQSNYNLLREETEGYSKLLTELFTTSNNEPPSSDVVEDTFERVKGMIGAFDMDVGRVLDVTLDVFAAVLVKQYRFCVKFLRASSWWPEDPAAAADQAAYSGLPKWALPGSPGWVTTEEERGEALRLNIERDGVFWDRVREIGTRAFFEIGRQVASETSRRKSTAALEGDTADEDDTDVWIRETGTLPPKGNRVAAQLLGFKLRFYSSETRNPSDVMPDNLIYLAALLIKVGFISLRDLYPHLWRPDESMDALKEEKMKEKLERDKAALPGGGTTNALMAAGALSDDTLPVPAKPRETSTRAGTPAKDQEQDKPASKADEKEQLPEPADQKILLLKSLLAIGALPESLIIIGRFPWLMDLYPELPEFIHRILHHCLSKVYASVRPFSPRESIKERRKAVTSDQSATPKGSVKLGEPAPRRVLRWALLDKEDTNDGTDYRFYWDDWADNIPICQSVDDVFALCGSFLNLSGFKIGQDSSLLSKLSRIGNQSLKEDSSDANKARWRDLCKRLLVPSLSLTKANPGVINEVFSLLSHFPRAERYSIYAEWYFGQISRMPEIKTAFDQARAETKDALKRLSKTNIRPMARTLAKVAYANPGIVINVAISQIESYENLIEVVVECARYFTDLAYDILTWSLINSLGQKGRSRVQESGLLTSRWLNALASFAGRAFKRYSSIMNPIPLLQYVGEQLQQNNSTDLIVLEQLISSMAGIVTDTYFNTSQTQAMGGGEILQAQTMLQLLDKRHESKTTSKRLMKALTESKLAGQLLIAIAQERVTCVFKESEGDAELKLLGNIFDEIHRVLTQYVDLLRTNFTVEEFDSFVPDVSSLIGEFGVQPEIAFWVSRPSLSQKVIDVDKQIQESAAANKAEADTEAITKTSDGDVIMEDGQQPETNGDNSGDAMAVDKIQDQTADETPTDEKSKDENSVTPPAKAVGEDFSWHPVLEDLMGKMKTVLPEEAWNVMGLPFYVTFWQLSLYDIYVPQKSYEDELERLKKRVIAISNDRSDISMAGTQKKDREKKQVNELHDRILAENKHHLKAYGHTRSRLQKEKLKWFEGMRGKHEALNIAIMQQCFLPRILLSPIEALYSFKMLKFMHSAGTPNFRTLGLLDQMFRDQRLTSIIFQCTSKEADNFGRFLNEVLQDLGRWHADKAVYEKEAFGVKKDLPGFSMAMDAAGKPTTLLDYEDFRRILYKWHRMLGASLKTCFTGGEYMHIRNAISVLKAIVQNFPAVNWIGRDMLTCVNNLKTSDSRDDVKIPAASLIGDLNRRESKWLLPQAFMINESIPSDKSAAGKPRTPQPRPETPKQLNATAAEFKPGQASTTTNVSESQPDSKMEVEEGEVGDVKDAAAKPEQQTSPEKETAEAKSGQQPDVAGGHEAATTDDVQDQSKQPTDGEKTSSSKPTTSQAVEPSREVAESRGRPRESSSRPASRAETKSNETSQPPSSPKRADVDRHPSLPNKPEPPRGRPPPPRQPAAASDRRDSRETRHENVSSAPHEVQDRERVHDYPNAPGYRGRGRVADRDRPEPPSGPRDTGRQPSEEQFGRHGPRDTGVRQGVPEWPERSDRGRLAPHDNYPPRHDPQRLSRADDVHPSRAGNISRPPEPPARQTPPPRQEREDRRPHPAPVAISPRRDDDHPAGRADRRDERDTRRPPPPPFPQHHDEPPVGPRGDRHVPASPSDTRTQPPQGPGDYRQPPHTSTQDSRFRPPSQDGFERPPEIPSGPRRGPTGRAGRRISTSQTHAPPASQPSPPRQPAERQPPTGPSNRQMRQPPAQDQSHPPVPSGPAPQPEQLDTSGIHPERLAKMQASSDSFHAQQPPSPASAQPPFGPRNAGPPPSGPSPVTRGASGAPPPGDRGRGDRRFAGLNNMLQQSSGSPTETTAQGTTIRGRGANRQPGGSLNNPMPPQASAGERSDAHPDSTTAGQPDLFPPRLNGSTQQPSSQRSAHEDDTRDRPARAGGETSTPQGPPSGHQTPDRASRGRERDRENTSRRGEDDGVRRSDSKREEHRDRTRDRERDRERDRDRDRGRSNRDEARDTRDSRESSSRRAAQGSTDNYDGPGGPGTRRRGRRERDEPTEGPAARPGPPPPPPPPPQTQPQPPSGPSDDRRWASSGRADDRTRDRDRNRERDRERERDRDREKDRNRDGGDTSRNGGGSGSGGTWPRKRGRPAGGNAADGQERRSSLRGGPGGGGNDNKRQRRGQ